MPTATLDHIFQTAVAAVNGGNLTEGRGLLEKCLAIDPNNAGVHDVLARVALEQGRVEDALASAQKAVTLRPLASHAVTLAEALSKAGKHEEAIGYFAKVLEKVPGDLRSLIGACDIYEKHGYKELAIECLERALLAQPKNWDVAKRYSKLVSGTRLVQGLAALERAAPAPTADLKARLAYLFDLVPYKEWAERARHGAMPFHSATLNDSFFKYAAQDRDACESIADQVLHENPESIRAIMAKAHCLVSRQQRHQAEVFYQAIAAKYPTEIYDNVVFSRQFYAAISAIPESKLEQGLPPLIEVAAATFTADHVIYVSCSHDYFINFGRTLLLSLDKTTAQAQIHLHIMDGSDDELGEARAFCGKLRQVAYAISAEKPGLIAKTPAARGYYHAIRFIRLLHHLKAYQRTLWLMDVDALINRDLQPMFEQIASSDVAFRARPGRWEPWHQFNASITGFRPTEDGINYLRMIATYIAAFYRQDRLRWGIDQLAMFAVHEYLREESRAPIVHLLDDRAVDYSYLDDGFVWCNSGLGKFQQLKQVMSRSDVPPDPERAKYFNALKAYAAMLE